MRLSFATPTVCMQLICMMLQKILEVVCPHGICPGWVLAPLLFDIFFVAFINVVYTRFKVDKDFMNALVHLSKRTGAGGRGEQRTESQPWWLCCEAYCTMMMLESPSICPSSSKI